MDHPDGIATRLREIQARTPQERWALACKMSVDIAGRVARGADLSIEMAEAFKGLLDLLTARSTDGIEGLPAKWRTRANTRASTGIADIDELDYGVARGERKCADELECVLSTAPPSAEIAATAEELPTAAEVCGILREYAQSSATEAEIAARVQAIREREQAATKGNWFTTRQRSSHDCYEQEYRIGASWPGVSEHYLGRVYHEPDAELIAHARADIPWLLAQLASALPVSRPTWRDIATAPTKDEDATRQRTPDVPGAAGSPRSPQPKGSKWPPFTTEREQQIDGWNK